MCHTAIRLPFSWDVPSCSNWVPECGTAVSPRTIAHLLRLSGSPSPFIYQPSLHSCYLSLPLIKVLSPVGQMAGFLQCEDRGLCVPLLLKARTEHPSVPWRGAFQRPLGVAQPLCISPEVGKEQGPARQQWPAGSGPPPYTFPHEECLNDVRSSYKLNQYLRSSHKENQDPESLEASSPVYLRKR